MRTSSTIPYHEGCPTAATTPNLRQRGRHTSSPRVRRPGDDPGQHIAEIVASRVNQSVVGMSQYRVNSDSADPAGRAIRITESIGPAVNRTCDIRARVTCPKCRPMERREHPLISCETFQLRHTLRHSIGMVEQEGCFHERGCWRYSTAAITPVVA